MLDRSDAEGLGRDDPGAVFVQRIKPASPEQVDQGVEVLHIGARSTAWYSGASVEPPVLVPGRPRAGGAVAEVLAGVLLGQEVGIDEIVTLFGARGREVAAVAEVADDLRRRVVGDEVTFVHNRNINYTNVCTFKCKFCGFSKGPLSLNLRGTPYLLTLDDIAARVRRGGRPRRHRGVPPGRHPPELRRRLLHRRHPGGEAGRARHARPRLHRARGDRGRQATRRAARRLPAPACATPVCARCPAPPPRSSTTRSAPCSARTRSTPRSGSRPTAPPTASGCNSNITIMFGAIEQPVHWARHIVRTRDLQKETGGFTEFVPLPFVHMAAPIYLQHKSRRGPTFREALLMHAVGRIAYHGWIDNIQVSWVKMGQAGVQQILQAGANDLGGTLMDENISRAAGASHGQGLEEADFRAIVEPLGRTLGQRTTLYGRAAVA